MPKLKRYSVLQVMNTHPCPDYTEERVKQLYGTAKRLSLKDMLELPIPACDVLWMVQELGLPWELLPAAFEDICNETFQQKDYYRDQEGLLDAWCRVWSDGCSRSVTYDTDQAQAARDYLYAQLIAGHYH